MLDTGPFLCAMLILDKIPKVNDPIALEPWMVPWSSLEPFVNSTMKREVSVHVNLLI